MNLDSVLLHKTFSHIYVEERIINHPNTIRILNKYQKSNVITIKHYKDVFNRSRQNSRVQSLSKSLILASNDGQLLYKGAPVCQSFGNDNFYYCTSVMNCPFDCDYCFLKGMYNTSNIVIFVNTDDYEEAIYNKLKEGDLYLCVSYDSDISAISGIFDYETFWANLAAKTEGLTIELRTKAVPHTYISSDSVIYAFTLSPDIIQRKFEKHTAPISSRIESIQKAIEAGCRVRLCFDPMIYIPSWKEEYAELIEILSNKVNINKVQDISVGTFRISKDYIKNLRKANPYSEAVQYPFEVRDGYCCYPAELESDMIEFTTNILKGYIDERRIYTV